MATGVISKPMGSIDNLAKTYTQNSLVTSTSFNRLRAYKKDGYLTLFGNMLVSSGAAASDFIEIGRFTGWSSVDTFYATVAPQTTGQPVISVQITTDGTIRLYRGDAATSESWYRFTAVVPYS